MLGGIRPGDQILSVNGIEFGGKSLEYVVEQMELLMENETIVILLFFIEYISLAFECGCVNWTEFCPLVPVENDEFPGLIHESRLIVVLKIFGED